MAPSIPQQLDDGDAIFLAMETPEAGGHVGAVMVLDPSTREGFNFEDLRDHIASRVALVPRFGWKLEEVPMDLDRPYWVETQDFDARDHVIRTAVPSPGNMKQVSALASRLHAQPMDRSRPLWEVWCIEGLEGGRVAIYMKTHHCLVDGTGGAGLSEVLADLSPDATAPPIVPNGFQEARPVSPSAWQLLSRAVSNGTKRPSKLVGHLGRGLRELIDSRGGEGVEVERRFFNQNISRRRAFSGTSFDFDRVRDLTKHFDVKVNDVMLEIVGAGVRRWLRDHGDASNVPLVAMCPVSTRGEEKGLGNQITSMAVPLATDLGDPAERVRAIHKNSKLAKQKLAKGSFDWIAVMGESFAPGVVSLLVGSAGLAGDSSPLPANFVVSNVRGTPMPLYLGGARVESMMPLSMLAVGQGMNVTLVSYCNRIDIGVIVDPELIPDVDGLMGYFTAALEELELAAEGVVHRAA